MRTLRGRLILSHLLPLLLILPLVGITLVYLVETQVFLTALSDELIQYGALGADMAREQPAIWGDAAAAQRFVTFYSLRSQSQVMLFDPGGYLLAASEARYADRLGQALDLPNLPAALAGEPQVRIDYSLDLQAEVIQILVPVMGTEQKLLGVVRLSRYLGDVQGKLGRLRVLIATTLGAGLLLAVAMALILGLGLGRSLQRVTAAVSGVARGRRWEPLPEEGPQEIRTLLVAFNSLIERLRVLEDSRRRLLANLIHELGRPIGALQSALQALLSGAEEQPELRRELLEGMDDQVHRLRPLLDSLTDLHGQVLGTLELNHEPISLSDWLPRVVTPWRQAAHDKGLHWQIEIADSLPVLEIDPDRLAQVLGNLLSNAIKYTPEGTVSVAAFVQDEGVVIAVSDTGVGIAPEEQTRVFEPFYRSQREKRFPQGMGLGLSIAQDLVTAHGGRLQVESAPGQGSRFTVWLPLQSSETLQPTSPRSWDDSCDRT